MAGRPKSSTTLLRLILPAIVVVGGSIDSYDAIENEPISNLNDNHSNSVNANVNVQNNNVRQKDLLRRRPEQLAEGHVSTDVTASSTIMAYDPNEAYVPAFEPAMENDGDDEHDYIDLTLPISVVIRNRALKKDKKNADANGKNKDKEQSVQNSYDAVLAKYQALGIAKANAQANAQSSTAGANAAVQASTVTVSANSVLQQQQQQQNIQPPAPVPRPAPAPKPATKPAKAPKPHPKPAPKPKPAPGGTGDNVVSHSSGVLHISAGTIDLRGVQGNPSTTPRKPTCTEVKPLLGCDRGGGENQLMKFWNRNFGTCKTCDRGLFKVMPVKMGKYLQCIAKTIFEFYKRNQGINIESFISFKFTRTCLFSQMSHHNLNVILTAYYCPEQGRPACGGKCHLVSADGKIRDKEGGVWDANDPRFREADRDSWGGFWPANFGCPLCG